MSISIGTPPFDILAIADTGSDLTWTQCSPCKKCYKQVAPLFKPNSSKTYRDATCDSSVCKSATGAKTSCSSLDDSCQYSVSYGDQSFSNGNIATDVLTLSSTSGRPVTFPNFIIGCSHNSDGTFDERGSGIVGLGGGVDSLTSQLTSSIGGKFSYCLVPFISGGNQTKNSSTLSFGSNAVVSGAGVVSTPIVKGETDTFYYLTLEGITVGSLNGKKNKKFINFRSSSSTPAAVSQGNIIIDSGTTLTLVPEEFYSDFESAVASELKNEKRVEDPSGTLSLCYQISSGKDFVSPSITMNFKGADVELSQLNTFVQVSDTVVCLSFVSAQGIAIYGNLAQMNFLVGYDRVKNTVSFKPTDCSTYN
uniref:Peptidase A1 domain-containing protein n=2 Tax=Cannabis sativa TaxID=3483 RepID=A0A803NLC9_CANSA